MQPPYFVPAHNNTPAYGSREWKDIQLARIEDYRQRLTAFSAATTAVIREAFPQVTGKTAVRFEDALDGYLTHGLLAHRQEVEAVHEPMGYGADDMLAELMDEREQLATQIANIEKILTGQQETMPQVEGLRELFKIMEHVALDPLRAKMEKIDGRLRRSHLNDAVRDTLEDEGPDLYPNQNKAATIMPDAIEEFKRRDKMGYRDRPDQVEQLTDEEVARMNTKKAPPLKGDGIGEV